MGISTFVGVRDNGDGTFTDIRVTASELVANVLANTRKVVTVLNENIGAGGTTLTDIFFTNTITEIVVGAQAYIAGVDFAQNGSIITGFNFSFYDGQKLIAKL